MTSATQTIARPGRQSPTAASDLLALKSRFRYRSAAHFIEVFKTYYGPMLKAFAALDPAEQKRLNEDMRALIARMNKADGGTMVVPSEYLEVVITKR